MPNNYFQFKQFEILQDKTAMKVGTDGVLLGAWTDINQSLSILDIGTGTGIIAIMIAQRSVNSLIDAIEIEEDAYLQALRNVKNCSWSNRIHVIHSSFQKYYKNINQKYDLIVSNPPFFSNLSRSESQKRANARHNTTLTLEELLQGVLSILSQNGRFCIILPVLEAEFFIQNAFNHNLFCNKKTFIIPTLLKAPKRVLMDFSFNNSFKQYKTNITIEKEKRHDYTDVYKELTKEFYLNF